MDASRYRPWLNAATRFLLSPRCLVCEADGMDGRALCGACGSGLVRNDVCCGRCAVPLPVAVAECDACRQRERPWADLWVPFVYTWPIDVLEARFKFAGSLVAGRVLADAWLAAGQPPTMPELILPVPLHTSRLRSRGYNQALELARPLGRHLGIPVRHDVLSRVKRTAAQTELDALTRARNVRGAFDVRRMPPQRHVALLDDVMTTGATLGECAQLLIEAGIPRVDVWALARTPAPGMPLTGPAPPRSPPTTPGPPSCSGGTP
ncbi:MULTISPECIES: ComF family protein [unclassified Luteibacter]|uniref:ComF family protein n=1 Tax=unclassified Luteibacter TaxID=2620188 RepID=UPI001EFA4D18|nr:MULTISPECIES: ComF family protein [unclassified Luteibacter]MDR6644596.1 ComF family protein [Luteibacter sp. 1214]